MSDVNSHNTGSTGATSEPEKPGVESRWAWGVIVVAVSFAFFYFCSVIPSPSNGNVKHCILHNPHGQCVLLGFSKSDAFTALAVLAAVAIPLILEINRLLVELDDMAGREGEVLELSSLQNTSPKKVEKERQHIRDRRFQLYNNISYMEMCNAAIVGAFAYIGIVMFAEGKKLVTAVAILCICGDIVMWWRRNNDVRWYREQLAQREWRSYKKQLCAVMFPTPTGRYKVNLGTHAPTIVSTCLLMSVCFLTTLVLLTELPTIDQHRNQTGVVGFMLLFLYCGMRLTTRSKDPHDLTKWWVNFVIIIVSTVTLGGMTALTAITLYCHYAIDLVTLISVVGIQALLLVDWFLSRSGTFGRHIFSRYLIDNSAYVTRCFPPTSLPDKKIRRLVSAQKDTACDWTLVSLSSACGVFLLLDVVGSIYAFTQSDHVLVGIGQRILPVSLAAALLTVFCAILYWQKAVKMSYKLNHGLIEGNHPWHHVFISLIASYQVVLIVVFFPNLPIPSVVFIAILITISSFVTYVGLGCIVTWASRNYITGCLKELGNSSDATGNPTFADPFITERRKLLEQYYENLDSASNADKQ